MSKNNDQPGKVSRRGFLKALGTGGVGLLTPSGAVAAGKGRVPQPSDNELATLLDLSRCIGCGECVSACRESNAHKFPEPVKSFPAMSPSKRAKPEDWSDKRDVEDRLTPYNWLFLQNAEVEYQGEVYDINIPRRCMHCQNPPCANMCPFGAANKQVNGLTRISDSLCMGGAKCRTVCPWSVPQRQSGVGLYLNIMPRFAGNGVMFKCDRCYRLLEKGELPACIAACPEDVQTIGPRGEIVARARELAAGMDGFIYGLEENGGTNTVYVSPVPFDLIDKAIDKDGPRGGRGKVAGGKAKGLGPGKPHMGPVKDVMADETNLATATLLAPVAGVVAGVLGLGAKLLKNGEEGSHES
ncbi:MULTISPECIES: 4Fe-4S dicluster domain-containing protein [unclassified Pseudodesulfovibrio]|uniref:4Fe-4S dicluster domain-containing protein n=1 Tax=unclassified Pseudodesulfovibrio TaxID=2661612 RepID=UPI000FEB6404|nr:MULTISPECIES: 4Fe-4S dicluster domain-containing protein [unclassified Pseudodesulfovibrio]MCJ2163321.1 4Fe-4S dicluster domain-containing protein [Pseudodesulfovibrio sp. S3-i]RWU06562.1 4Fe-4S dicluster domain-containing protein [Pseudodesulfovibrio sp. S3]